MDYHSSKHKELLEQLTSWWGTQTNFKTKKALADFLKVHPDTLGDYFSGRTFPKSNIANRLWELANIPCLKPDAVADSFSEMVPESSTPPLPPLPHGAASTEKPQETGITGLSSALGEKHHSGGIPEMKDTQQPEESPKRGERDKERSVTISLERTSCPFCAHDIAKFHTCVYCGQIFVWANVPIGQDESLLGF